MATLPEVTEAVLAALGASGAPHALAGGLAANLWVADEHQQATFDVDVAIARPSDGFDRKYVERWARKLGAWRFVGRALRSAEPR